MQWKLEIEFSAIEDLTYLQFVPENAYLSTSPALTAGALSIAVTGVRDYSTPANVLALTLASDSRVLLSKSATVPIFFVPTHSYIQRLDFELVDLALHALPVQLLQVRKCPAHAADRIRLTIKPLMNSYPCTRFS